MSCHEQFVILLLAALVACGPSTGGSTESSGEAPTSDAATDPITTGAPPATTGDGTPTTDATTSGTTEADPTTGELGSCDVAQGDHAAACRAPDCAITVDLEIRCHDHDFASRGVGVAPAPDGTWYMAGRYFSPAQLFRVDADVTEQITGVIDDYMDRTLLMTQGPDGAPHIGVDAEAPNWEGGLHYLTRMDGAWTDTLVAGAERFLIDVKVDSQGRPHVFFADDGYGAAVLDGGTWTTHTLADLGSAAQFVLGPDDDEIVIAVADQQIQALVGDQMVELGSSLPVGTFYYQAATAAAGPTLAAALHLGDGLEVAWWPDPAAVAIPGSPVLVDACPSIGVDDPDAMCPGPCHDGGAGMVANAFAFARSADGAGWLAWIVTHRDLDFHYELADFEGTLSCQAIVDGGDTIDVLHLARVPLDGDAPAEVLTLPLPDLAQGVFTGLSGRPVGPVVLAAFGSDLALALRLRSDPEMMQFPYARIVRIDTTKLP